MWKAIRERFESNSIYPDCTRALVHLMGSNEPQLFYHRETPNKNRLDVHAHGDILVGIRIPRVESRYWGFSSEPNVLSLHIDDQVARLRIVPDRLTFPINGTHPLVFIGHNLGSEVITDTAYPHIDFVWCVLPHDLRKKLAYSHLMYQSDGFNINMESQSLIDLGCDPDRITVPNLKIL